MSVDLDAIEKLCGKQTFTAYGSEVLLGSLADEVPGLIAELRALRAERDALRRRCEETIRIDFEAIAEVETERDALRARIEELNKLQTKTDLVAELTAGLDMMFTSQHKLLDERDKDRARVVELERSLDEMIGTHGVPCVHFPCEVLKRAKAVRG